MFLESGIDFYFNFTIVFWKILTPIQLVLLFIWTAFCFFPAIIFRFILMTEKSFGFFEKYVWGPVVCWICLTNMKATGKDNFPKDRNVIVASNHESWLDIPALFAVSPTYLYFIAKKELKKTPFIGWAIWGAGMVFIDRSNRNKAMQSMREAGEKAKSQNKNIVAFPEGSRTKTGKMGQFKRGTFIVSKQTDIEILPCAIKGAREVWPSEQLVIRPGKIQIAFGEPISPKDHEDKTPEEFADYVRNVVMDLRATLQ